MDKHKLLYPPIPVGPLKNDEKALYIFDQKMEAVRGIFVDKCGEAEIFNISHRCIPSFLNSHRCMNVKIAIICGFNLENHGYSNGVAFRQMICQGFRTKQIPIYFINQETYYLTAMLLTADVDLSPGECVSTVTIGDADIHKLYRHVEGYAVVQRGLEEVTTETAFAKVDHKLVVAADLTDGECGNIMELLVSGFRPTPVKIVKFDQVNPAKFAKAFIKNIVDPSFTKFHILPTCFDTFVVTNKKNPSKNDVVIKTKQFQSLPSEYSKIVPKSWKPYYVSLFHTHLPSLIDSRFICVYILDWILE